MPSSQHKLLQVTRALSIFRSFVGFITKCLREAERSQIYLSDVCIQNSSYNVVTACRDAIFHFVQFSPLLAFQRYFLHSQLREKNIIVCYFCESASNSEMKIVCVFRFSAASKVILRSYVEIREVEISIYIYIAYEISSLSE